MKFTKEEAFEKLKGILTNNGKKTLRMSEKSIEKQLETLMPLIANDEMELDDFIGKVQGAFSTMNSNMEKDTADFVKKWQADHPTPTPPPAEPDDEVTKALQKRLEELEKKEAIREKEHNIAMVKAQLLNAMKEKGIKDEQWSKDFIEEISIGDDFDVDKKAEAYVKIYNKSHAVIEHNTPKNSTGDVRKDEDLFADARKIIRQRRGIFEQTTSSNQDNGK